MSPGLLREFPTARDKSARPGNEANFMIFTRSACKDIWRFMYTFSNISKNLTALGVRNELPRIYYINLTKLYLNS